MLGGIDPEDYSDDNRRKAETQLTPMAHFLARRQDLLCALLIANTQNKGSTERSIGRSNYAQEFISDYKEEAKQAMGSQPSWTKTEVVGKPHPGPFSPSSSKSKTQVIAFILTFMTTMLFKALHMVCCLFFLHLAVS